MIDTEIDTRIRKVIAGIPSPHKNDLLTIWEGWIATNPEPPFYVSWSDYSAQWDDSEALYTERRVYLRRITNELRDIEVPKTMWQKAAKALAAVASAFFVIFLALSRVARGAE
ncbi:MAG: hypothetical protein ACTSYL_03980 [Candidatus Thorarchaeota archaeon]